jgi:hypothetical protein
MPDIKYVWELFKFTSSSDIDWVNKSVKLKGSIKITYNYLTHYQSTSTSSHETKTTNKKPKFTFKSIKTIWLNEMNNISTKWILEFNKMQYGSDYFIMPLLYLQNHFYIGIVLLNQKYLINPNIFKNVITISFLSNIDNITGQNINISQKYNIFKGHIKHIENCSHYIILGNDDNKSIHNISICYILKNSKNYIPTLEIIYITYDRNMFQSVFSKSSKSNILPTSLPATLSAPS